MKLKNILITLPLLFPLTSFADVSSCASFLTLANFNLSQSGNNADIDALKKATFCSSSYKSDPDQDSLIESAGYYLFNVNPAQIASTQKEICGDVFGSNAYLKDASIPVKNAYSAAFKSWDNCQELSKKEGVNFDMQLDPLMRSLTVTLSTNSTNNVVPFQGLMQSLGGGHSICKTTSSSRANSKLTKVIAVDDTTGFDFDANNKLKITCNRQMQKDSNGESADAQTLTFNTKVGTYQVPLAATGVLSRVSVDKVMNDIQSTMGATLVPAGTVVPFASDKVPEGYLLCDGRSLSRIDYPKLFSAIGTAHGSVDANSFNLPDYRGLFLRGVDGLAGNDPDKDARTQMKTGGNAGNLVGSVQGDMFASHSHTYNTYGDEFHDKLGPWAAGGPQLYRIESTNSTGSSNETRPKNAYVNYVVKF